jgi:ubiquinone/menaquinone biosynthesis C-methylase UbiE
MKTYFRQLELEPPPWLYVLMARGPLFRRIYRRFVSDLKDKVPASARLLDVGTGPGYLLGYLAQQRPDLELFGLDLSHHMISGGRRRLTNLASGTGIHGLVGNSQVLPFKEASFDQALVTFSFHIWSEPARAVAEMVRVLKPGGRAWIYEMNREAARRQLKDFAREEKFPFFFVFLGFNSLSWNHALRAADFAMVFEEAGITAWHLTPAHHLFWRVEIWKD